MYRLNYQKTRGKNLNLSVYVLLSNKTQLTGAHNANP